MTTVVYVSLELGPENTEVLKDLLISYNLQDYKVQRSSKDPAHVTLCYYSDFKTLVLFETFIEQYNKEENYDISVDSIVYDDYCVAFTVNADVPFYPKDKNLHITMMLNNKKPIYSNKLIKDSNRKIICLKDKNISFSCPIIFNYN